MQLPNMEDVVSRLNDETPLADKKIDLHALFYAAMVHALNKRNARLIRPPKLRRGHLMIGINPFKRRHVIGRVKRAQYKNAKKHRRVYARSAHGGHF